MRWINNAPLLPGVAPSLAASTTAHDGVSSGSGERSTEVAAGTSGTLAAVAGGAAAQV
jgi:hypothetical protein